VSEINFNGMRIRYEYLPAIDSPKGNIIFLHTIGKSLEDSDDLIPYFQSEYNILRYDLLGHGQSELPSEFITIELLLEQLLFMSDQFFTQNFYIVANPASGYVATRFCRYHGDRVSGLVLISPPPAFLPFQERQSIVSQMKEKACISFEYFKQFMISNLTIKQDSASISALKALFDQVTERAYFEFMDSYLTEDLNEDFKHIPNPIVVLAGAQDKLFPPSVHGITANFIGAQFEVIPHASTLVAFDNPEWTAAAIIRFTDETLSRTSVETGFRLNHQKITSSLHEGFKDVHSHRILSIKLVNTFQVRIGEVEITKGWNHRKAKSLLLYLIFHGTATREELINLFWPELEMGKAQNHLRVSLNYLKSLLNGAQGIHFIHADREHVFLQGDIHCDALDYRKELEEVYLQSDPQVRFKLAQQILQVSPQKLLSHIYDDWFLGIRESIEIQYCALCRWVADRLRSVGRFEEASMYDMKVEKIGLFLDHEEASTN
jgi:pimeloyl-ACP methyl ester carboxylesterase